MPSSHTAQTSAPAGSCSQPCRQERERETESGSGRGQKRWVCESQLQTGKGNKGFPEERWESLLGEMEECHIKQAWAEEGLMHLQLCGPPGNGLRRGYISGSRRNPPGLLLLLQPLCTEVAAEGPHPAGLKVPRNGVKEPLS